MNVDENGPVAKATVQNMAVFLFVKWQDEDNNKEGLTILKKHQPDMSHNMLRIGFIIFTPAHDLDNWTLLYWGESMWPED